MKAHLLAQLLATPHEDVPADLVLAAENIASVYRVSPNLVKVLRCTGPDCIIPESGMMTVDLVTLEGSGQLQKGVEFTGARPYCPGTVGRLATRQSIMVKPAKPSTFALLPASTTYDAQFEFADRRDPLAM